GPEAVAFRREVNGVVVGVHLRDVAVVVVNDEVDPPGAFLAHWDVDDGARGDNRPTGGVLHRFEMAMVTYWGPSTRDLVADVLTGVVRDVHKILPSEASCRQPARGKLLNRSAFAFHDLELLGNLVTPLGSDGNLVESRRELCCGDIQHQP